MRYASTRRGQHILTRTLTPTSRKKKIHIPYSHTVVLLNIPTAGSHATGDIGSFSQNPDPARLLLPSSPPAPEKRAQPALGWGARLGRRRPLNLLCLCLCDSRALASSCCCRHLFRCCGGGVYWRGRTKSGRLLLLLGLLLPGALLQAVHVKLHVIERDVEKQGFLVLLVVRRERAAVVGQPIVLQSIALLCQLLVQLIEILAYEWEKRGVAVYNGISLER